MEKIQIDKKYRIPNAGSSDGAQGKYYSNGLWYKKDFCGGGRL